MLPAHFQLAKLKNANNVRKLEELKGNRAATKIQAIQRGKQTRKDPSIYVGKLNRTLAILEKIKINQEKMNHVALINEHFLANKDIGITSVESAPRVHFELSKDLIHTTPISLQQMIPMKFKQEYERAVVDIKYDIKQIEAMGLSVQHNSYMKPIQDVGFPISHSVCDPTGACQDHTTRVSLSIYFVTGWNQLHFPFKAMIDDRLTTATPDNERKPKRIQILPATPLEIKFIKKLTDFVKNLKLDQTSWHTFHQSEESDYSGDDTKYPSTSKAIGGGIAVRKNKRRLTLKNTRKKQGETKSGCKRRKTRKGKQRRKRKKRKRRRKTKKKKRNGEN